MEQAPEQLARTGYAARAAERLDQLDLRTVAGDVTMHSVVNNGSARFGITEVRLRSVAARSGSSLIACGGLDESRRQPVECADARSARRS
jgi:hypothetical protein